MRVVTTLPSATEIVAALGIDPVGVSHECDYPPRVASLPAVTGSRIDASRSSAEIDRQVLEAGAESGVYDVDEGTLAALEPDLVVTQGLCDVCAVDEVTVRDAVERISEARRASGSRTQPDDDSGPDVLTTDPHSVADVFADIRRIAAATRREERADELLADLESRIDVVRERTSSLDGRRPRVAVFDWTDPVMFAGHWTAELVEWAGGQYPVDVGERSRPREWGEIRAYDPEVIVVAPCGFDLQQIAENRTDLTRLEGWDELSAVRTGRVWAIDGDRYLNRPGPRLVDALEALAPIVRPEAFEGDEFPAESAERLDEPIAIPFADLEEFDSVPASRAGSTPHR